MNTPPLGILYALGAAFLFGLSTPLAKGLSENISPVLLAGVLYLGSGVGLSLLRGIRCLMADKAVGERAAGEAAISRAQWPYLGGAIGFGGVLGPLLLMFGLRATTGATASLLLNLEGVLTALLAWFLFREAFDRRIALGMAFIIAGGVLLSWQGGRLSLSPGALFIAGACGCWAIDNNLTQKVSAHDPLQIAIWKGLVAGTVNTLLAVALGASLPSWWILVATMSVGFAGYGLSLVGFVLALRHLGTSRTGAYFSLAPFVGAIASLLLLRESVGAMFWPAALLMGVGVWLHLTEHHQHEHTHEWLQHAHRHLHDEHHQHPHAPGINPREPHSHSHIHAVLTHSHPHFPDIHHRHPHEAAGERLETINP